MKSTLDKIEHWFDGLLYLLHGMVAASIGLIAILIPLNLLLVKAQLGAMGWLNEAVEYTLYVGVFLGAPWVLNKGAHVRVDVLMTVLPHKWAVFMERFIDLIGLALCAVLCFYGSRSTIWEYVDGTFPNKDLQIANWIMMAVFSVSFFFLACEFFFRFRRASSIIDNEIDNHMKASM